MLKAFGCFMFGFIAWKLIGKEELYFPLIIFSFVLWLYIIPFLYKKIRSSMNEKRWKKQAELERINRENTAEYEHQTALRRERERLEMQAEVRVRELMATLEVQYHSDSQKMQQLTQMKKEMANRQQSDMVSLLGRLEAMKAG